MQPPPAGLWGMSPDVLHTLPGYGADIRQNRAEARQIMQSSATGPITGSRSRCRCATCPICEIPQ